MDDITYCKRGFSGCMITTCYRHPQNIENINMPHSYADLYRTECCPIASIQNDPICRKLYKLTDKNETHE